MVRTDTSQVETAVSLSADSFCLRRYSVSRQTIQLASDSRLSESVLKLVEPLSSSCIQVLLGYEYDSSIRTNDLRNLSEVSEICFV